jgi:anti-sigma regulatory factor (Ser/Thr protein kinase)
MPTHPELAHLVRKPADPDVLADVRYRALPEHARLVRNLIGSTADLYGAAPQTVDDLRMCVSEAFNNVAVHATGAITRVRLLTDHTHNRWIIEVTDNGSGTIRLPAGRADPIVMGEEPEGGFGLQVIKATADEVATECRAGGETLAFAVRGTAAEIGSNTTSRVSSRSTFRVW